jgi:hypothetical protein
MSETTTTLTEGSTVTDRDTEDDDRLRVVGTYEDRADEWVIDDLDATVAELNPEYPPDDRVVACAYLEDVRAEHGQGAPVDVVQRSAAFGDLRTYTFPRSRLRRVTGGEQQ